MEGLEPKRLVVGDVVDGSGGGALLRWVRAVSPYLLAPVTPLRWFQLRVLWGLPALAPPHGLGELSIARKEWIELRRSFVVPFRC